MTLKTSIKRARSIQGLANKPQLMKCLTSRSIASQRIKKHSGKDLSNLKHLFTLLKRHITWIKATYQSKRAFNFSRNSLSSFVSRTIISKICVRSKTSKLTNLYTIIVSIRSNILSINAFKSILCSRSKLNPVS